MSTPNIQYGLVSQSNMDNINIDPGAVILTKDKPKIAYNAGNGTQTIEALSLDTIDTFYDEEVQNPYIQLERPSLTEDHKYTYSGPYEINSILDIVKTYKYIENNADLLTLKLDELSITINDEIISLVDDQSEAGVLMNGLLDFSASGSDGMMYGQPLYDFLQSMKAVDDNITDYSQIPDHIHQSGMYVVRDSQLSSAIYLMSYKQPNESEWWGVVNDISTLRDKVSLYCISKPPTSILMLFELSEDSPQIKLCSNISIHGNVYIEHFADAFRYIRDFGYVSSSFQISNCKDDMLPALEIPGDIVSGYDTPYNTHVWLNKMIAVIFGDNFLFRTNADDPSSSVLPQLGGQFGTDGDMINLIHVLTNPDILIGNLSVTSLLQNPNYRSVLGWEKVHEATLYDFNYIIHESDYGKYDYNLVISSDTGDIPTVKVYLSMLNRYQYKFNYWKQNTLVSKVVHSIKQDLVSTSISEHIYALGDYSGSGEETVRYIGTDKGVIVTRIRIDSSQYSTSEQDYNCKVELYRKRCC